MNNTQYIKYVMELCNQEYNGNFKECMRAIQTFNEGGF
jgi:hypothetical protein